MPRPAAKRNRLATRTLKHSKQALSHESSRDNVGSRDISRSPRSELAGSSRLANSADPSDIIRQLRNQTPLSKSHEFALGSSPGTEQGATGSRPPTRARGYSSTLSIAGRKGDTSSRIPGTPAFESSVLSNFRRRPRQASILHMMQDEDGSSDYDDDDFLGGLSPEDESTPLDISRGKSLALRPAVFSAEASPTLPSSGNSSKRKRPSAGRNAPQPSSQTASSAPGSPTPCIEFRQREVSADWPRLSQSPATVSETMVPPMSSPVPDLTRESSTPDSDRLSPQAKARRDPKTRKSRDGELGISTAALQDKLLPRRRQKRKARQGASRFDVPSESEEDDLSSILPDDDELSYLPMQKRVRTPQRPAIRPKQVHENRGKIESRSNGKTPKTLKQYGASAREDTSGGTENEPADMSSPLSSALDTDELDSEFELDPEAPAKTYLSEELRLQALKFAEVDRWQMEFEDVITVNTQENGAFR
ncbi:uncharacterized protein BDV14DRAFT_100254 [Aspergillus stella-maris]|uniref:uncharacterized protein n=1 Tax=Aspergillus stella-maris TaxID=1810926 RepID=UPI003CCE3512